MDQKRSHLFVSVQNADGRPDPRVRKTLRSWVTTAQHDHRRRYQKQWQVANPVEVLKDENASNLTALRSSSNAYPSPSSSSEDSTFFSPQSRKDSSTGLVESWTFMPEEPTGKRHPAAGRQVRSHVARRQHRQRRETSERAVHTVGTPISTCTFDESPECDSTEISRPDSPVSLLSPRSFLDNPDMFTEYAEELQVTTLQLWSHYLWQEHQHGPIFRTQYKGFVGFAPRCLHPLILSNQTMLATSVLFTGCHLRYLRNEPVMSPALIRIRSRAYSFVQAAIDNDQEALTDATFLGVIKLALFEVIFGDRKTFRIHMQGILQMVRLRKGLANLGMDGYVAHLLVWFDANLSAIAKIPRYLAEEASLAGMKQIESDAEGFALGVESSR